MNYFVKGNPDLCIGCRTCMIGCVVAHEGKRIFEVDPDSYDFNPRLHVVRTVRLSVPVQCKHCENPRYSASTVKIRPVWPSVRWEPFLRRITA